MIKSYKCLKTVRMNADNGMFGIRKYAIAVCGTVTMGDTNKESAVLHTYWELLQQFLTCTVTVSKAFPVLFSISSVLASACQGLQGCRRCSRTM